MIETEMRGDVAVLTLARGKGNALNLDFMKAIVTALDEVEASSARSVVLTGQGSVFGAGVDLPEMLAGGEDYVREFLPGLSKLLETLALFPKPLVAAVNGHAIAGGAIIVFACDQRILARGKAKVGLSEVLVGVRFPAWALEIARFAVPPQHFSTVLLTGRSFAADDAFARGLVDELVEPDALLDRAVRVAEEMGSILPETFRETKRAVRRPMIEAVQATIGHDNAIVDYWCSPPVRETIETFVKRMIGTGK